MQTRTCRHQSLSFPLPIAMQRGKRAVGPSPAQLEQWRTTWQRHRHRVPPTKATTKTLGSNAAETGRRTWAREKTGLAWKVVLIWQIVCTLRTALCALLKQHEFCYYWSTITSSCSERGPFHRRIRLWLLCLVCFVAPPSSLIVLSQ